MKMKSYVVFSTIALSCFILKAGTFHVWRDNPAPQAPYDSWETAATEIQVALDLAKDGDTVLVEAGVYDTGGMLTPGFSLTNRVCATNAVAIRSVAPTREGAVIVGAAADGGSYGSNAVRCVYLDGGATISGFTITGGFTHTNNSVYQDAAGGGIFMGSGTVVSNCLVATNSAAYHGGGAVFNQPDHALIIDSEFEFNRSEGMGGGVYCHEGWGVVDDCIIHDNYAHNLNKDSGGGGGGVASLMPDAKATLKCVDVLSSFIYNNSTRGVGGGIYTYRGRSMITSCVVSNNTGGTGGIYYWIGGATVSDCLITHNTGNTASTGTGGIYIYAAGTIENCLIINNTSKFSGGLFARVGTVRNCLIARNFASKAGGGVYYSNDTTLLNCTIVNNESGAGVGHGVYFDKVDGTLRNSIVWGNGDDEISFTSTPNISYTCSWPLLDGEGNIDADPRFANTNRFNYTLSGGSPAIDAGLNEAWMDTLNDLKGKPRIRNGVVDLGSYEYYSIGTFLKIR